MNNAGMDEMGFIVCEMLNQSRKTSHFAPPYTCIYGIVCFGTFTHVLLPMG